MATQAAESAPSYILPKPHNYHDLSFRPTKAGRTVMPYRVLAAAARMGPDRKAVITPERTLSFTDLHDLILRLASGLRVLGLRPGEAIATLVGNRWEQLPLMLATGRIGGVYMAASRFLTPNEIQLQIEELRPKLIIGNGGYAIEEVLDAADGDPGEVFADEDAGFAIRFSSGTTGRPKMMIGSHRVLGLQHIGTASDTGLTHRDVQLVAGPLAHAASNHAMAQLIVGGAIHLKEAFDKATFWDDCRENGITNTMVVPTMIASALDYPGDAPQLRAVSSLGASLAPALKRRLIERFPNLGLYEMYGSAEMSMVTCLRPEDQLERPTSVGRPCMGVEVAIFDDEGAPVPHGQIGTIYARSAVIASRPIGTVPPPPIPQNLLDEGWATSGDVGMLDEDGYLYVSDRRVDLILSGGLNVYPAEVEAVLAMVPGAKSSAVVGLADERWGQRVTAYIEGQCSEEEVIAICRANLAAYKVPRKIFFVEELRRTASGKISRKLVRDDVAEGRLPS